MNFNGKSVIVTGGAGFIGSTLVRELVKQNADVTVVDNFVSGKSEFLDEVLSSIDLLYLSILDKDFEKVLERKDAQFVFNLAALPYIPDSYSKPFEFFEVNAIGAMKVLMASKNVGVERILQYSTSEVYGSAESPVYPMRENHPINPRSTYAVSKVAADRVCYTLHHEQEIPVIILRQFNVYGPRETHPYIIPEIISQFSNSNKLKLGNVSAKRDFTYVEDAVKASVLLMKEKTAIGEVFNSGSGVDYSIRAIINFIAEVMGIENIDFLIDKTRLRPLDVERLQANYQKLHELTEWHPKTSFREGLEKTVNWFNENGKKWSWEKR